MNLLQYSILGIIFGFIISVFLSPKIIPLLKKLKLGQNVRPDGPKSHLEKAGTPSMGGLIFFLSLTIVSLILFFKFFSLEILLILFSTFAFGAVGFLDDYIKVIKKRSLGLIAYQKIAIQLIITVIIILILISNGYTNIYIPFMGDKTFDLSWFYIIFSFIVIIGTVNAVNLTDGLDGLSTTVTIIVLLFFIIFAILKENIISPFIGGLIGSLLGFLLFNSHPAKVFMGDTGSLGLGGFVVTVAMILRLPLFIAIVGIIYLAEAISVFLQVIYFKKTGGKRLFKMAPLHHHFELNGMSEMQVVNMFSVITFLMCLIGILGIIKIFV